MAKQKTLYFLQTYGQLGNQLATLAHLLAFAIEYDYVIVYPQSDYLSNHLEIAKKKNSRLQFSRQLARKKLSGSLNKLMKLLFLNRNTFVFGYLVINKKFVVEEQFDTAKQPDVIVITDWLFRYYDGIIKHQNAIRNCLSFTQESTEKANQKWLSLQAKYPQHTFIGIHVRRGDYATWLDGKYFFDDHTYYTWLVQLSEQVEKPVFIVCSNEDLCFDNENSLTVVYEKGSPSEDLFLLSCCRYIVGPPSTFSSWSAFSGNQDLLFVRDRNDSVKLENFTKFYLK